MTPEKLNELLNRALEIITSLEGFANEDLAKEIDDLFEEVLHYSDEKPSPPNADLGSEINR